VRRVRAARLARALLGITCLALAQPARAVEWGSWRVDVTNSLAVEAHLDNADGTAGNDDFQMIREKLTLAVLKDIYRLEGRFEGVKFLSLPGSGRAPAPFEDVVEPEKLTFEARARGTRVWLGDAYQVLGRGFLLSLKKMDELGLDTTLRGAKAEYRDRQVSITGFGGFVNVVNLDTSTWKRVSDPNDLVTGAALAWRAPVGLEVGAHGLYVKNRQDLPPQNDHAALDTWGAGATLEWRRLGLYAEADVLRRREVTYLPGQALDVRYEEREISGWAAFLSALQRFGPVTVLAEAKWTDTFALEATPRPGDGTRGISPIPLNAPPTLEKEDLRLAPHETALGGRARVSVALDAIDAVASASYARFFDPPGDAGYDDVQAIDHAWGTWEQRFGGGRVVLNGTGGFRREAKKAPEPDHRLWYAELEGQAPLAPGYAVELIARHEDYADDNPGRGTDAWREGTLGATFTFFSDLVAALTLDYSTKPTIERTWFPAGSLEWKYGRGSGIKAFYGMTRGGLRCVGGVCKVLPPFHGATLQWVQTF